MISQYCCEFSELFCYIEALNEAQYYKQRFNTIGSTKNKSSAN